MSFKHALKLEQLYFIGGGTCCGKSSISQLLCEKYGCHYYKQDDFLDEYMRVIAEKGNLVAQKVNNYTMEEMWMRDPAAMCDEETELYKDMFQCVLDDLQQLPEDKPVLAEGAGLMPGVIHELGVLKNRYVCIVPEKKFQIDNYTRRPWIHHYLEGTSDTPKAFSNWMERDARFSKQVLQEAMTLGYETIIVDGQKTVEENMKLVETIFCLG